MVKRSDVGPEMTISLLFVAFAIIVILLMAMKWINILLGSGLFLIGVGIASTVSAYFLNRQIKTVSVDPEKKLLDEVHARVKRSVRLRIILAAYGYAGGVLLLLLALLS